MEIDGIEIGPGANLEGKDLANQDLGKLCLSEANLKGANLSGANLNGANLRGANLGGAFLSGANLSGANLTDANLDGAFLTKAKLRSAVVEPGSAASASFRQADLYGSTIQFNDFYLPLGTDFTEADFTGARISGFLDGMTFTNAKFERTSFLNLSSGDTRIWNSNLYGAQIKNCVVLNEAEDGVQLPVSIAGTSLEAVEISDSVLRRLHIDDGRGDLNYLKVRDSDLSFFNMEEGTLTFGSFVNVNLSNSSLGGQWTKSEFVECDFSGTKFSGDWAGARFFDCKFDQASFNAYLKGSIFEGPGLDQIDFGDSDFGDDETL